MQDSLQITFIGHATCCIRTSRGTILTDPHFGRRVLWWPRARPLTAQPSALPPPAAVVISHAHCDHLDIEGFKYIPSATPVIVPPGMGRALYRFVNNPVIEVAHWVPYDCGNGLTITPVPVRHFGGRLVPNLRYRQNSGYVITAGAHTIYFAGDTAYGTHFREVGHLYAARGHGPALSEHEDRARQRRVRLRRKREGEAPVALPNEGPPEAGPPPAEATRLPAGRVEGSPGIDVALLPIEALAPAWWPFARGLNGLEVMQAFCDLKAKHLIPIHWGSFGSPKVWERSLGRLERHMGERQMENQFHRLAPETTWTLQ